MDSRDVKKIQYEKNKKRLEMYKKLSKKCFSRIEHSVVNNQSFCMYQIVAFQFGYPLYNMTQYITYLMKILNHKGFFVKFVKPNIIFISWGFSGS